MIPQRLVCHLKLLHSKNGWILLDSLLAFLILTVGILAVIAAFTQTTKSAYFSDQATQATYLAQQSLEKLKYFDGKTIAPVLPSTSTRGILTMEHTRDTATQAISPLNGLNLVPVKVTVTWLDPAFNNAPRSIAISSYYFYYNE